MLITSDVEPHPQPGCVNEPVSPEVAGRRMGEGGGSTGPAPAEVQYIAIDDAPEKAREDVAPLGVALCLGYLLPPEPASEKREAVWGWGWGGEGEGRRRGEGRTRAGGRGEEASELEHAGRTRSTQR